jgi:hypothetical protein
MQSLKVAHSSSFRDPAGHIFYSNSILYRSISNGYKENYKKLMESGLYEALREAGLLVPHEDVSETFCEPDTETYKIIQPLEIKFISFPYEWAFSQLKDAALATLQILKKSLEFGMELKDASAYNIQFHQGKPLLIDTLSFQQYKPGAPWIAYKQFCQHFLAPLALMAKVDVRLSGLLKNHIDGVPIDLASKILPSATYFNLGLLTHIHLHAKTQKKYEGQQPGIKKMELGKFGLLGIIDSLENCIKGLRWNPGGTEWAEYYSNTNYTDHAFKNKKEAVEAFIDKAKPANLLDLGANAGIFSRLASNKEIYTISTDYDPAAIEKSYLFAKENKEINFLPLLVDLSNPAPAIGWGNEERASFFKRSKYDMVMALALIHHLAISNNLPFHKIASFLKENAQWLIIEFVPKNDSQVQILLKTREDIFNQYSEDVFEMEFSRYFEIIDSRPIPGSERKLYLMKRK